MSRARLEIKDGALALYSPYNQDLVAAIKQLPASDRRWNCDDRAWMIDPRHGDSVAAIVLSCLGEMVMVPQPIAASQSTKLHKLEYLGRPKDRGGDELVAYGYCDGDWSLAFSLSALRYWFDPTNHTSKPTDRPTLYGILGIPRSAVGINIKKAYRRMARQWHPDICKEPDAADQFRQIQQAYEVLTNVGKRVRYDTGLKVEASQNRQGLGAHVFGNATNEAMYGYRPPLRCGYVLAEGVNRVGRFWVKRILKWEDITGAGGKVMVSYWPKGGDEFEVRWV